MYAKGMTPRQISETIEDIYGFETSEGFISDVTDKILPQIEDWQNRPLLDCRPLFICAVCINYRLNLLHKGIIVALVINSAEHWFAYNIAISVNKYSCWKGHDF